jgi:regulator of RNase E activity RraA
LTARPDAYIIGKKLNWKIPLSGGFIMEIGTKKTLPKSIIEGFKDVPTSTIGTIMDKMGINGIINGLRCLIPGIRIAGSAFTVRESVGTLDTYTKADFPVGEAIDLMEAGDILVIDLGGQEVSTMGGLGSLAMKLKGVAGMVIDGGIRDAEQIISQGFPGYVAHICARSGQTRIKWLAANCPVKICDVMVNPGDIIVADDTAVAVVPLGNAEEILKQAQRIEELEKKFEAELKKGSTFRETSKKLGIV